MAKKTAIVSESKTVKAPKATKRAKVEFSIAFGAWVKTARARADKKVAGVPELLVDLKADKKLKDDAKLANVAKRFEGNEAFAVIAARYEGFAKRGSQSKKAA